MDIAEQEEASRLLEELEATKIWRKQHDKQKALTRSMARVRAMFGGNITGKTVWGAQEVCRFVFNSHETRKIDLPIEVWVCCPSYDLQIDTTQKKLLGMIPTHRIVDKTYVRKGVLGSIKLDNGSLIGFKSYEQGRGKFQGARKRLVWLDEEPPKDIWDEINVRQEAGKDMDIILTMTPVNGMTWIYDTIYLKTDDPDIFVINVDWDDNPFLTEEQKEGLKRRYTADALQVRKSGKFIQRSGLVANWFNRDIHIAQDLKPLPDWTIWRIVDFGWSSSKSCVLWIGVDSKDRCFLFDGLYVNETLDEELAKLIKDRETFRVSRSIADNQPDRIKTLQKNGVRCEPIVKATGKEDNWDVLRAEAMAQIGKVDPITHESRLKISAKLVYFDSKENKTTNWFLEEIENLRWKEMRVSGEKQETARWNKSGGIDGAHFDAMDAFSYFCVEKNRKIKRPTGRKMVHKFVRRVNRLAGY